MKLFSRSFRLFENVIDLSLEWEEPAKFGSLDFSGMKVWISLLVVVMLTGLVPLRLIWPSSALI